jgi:hypothetical protein
MRSMSLMVVMLFVAAACSASGPSQTGEADPVDAAESAPEQEDADEEALEGFASDAGRVTSLDWGDDGSLRVGFADGRWARVVLGEREATLAEIAPSDVAIVGVSPAAKVAFAALEPMVLVRLRDGHEVMRLHGVGDVASAGFLAKGEGVFAVEPDGQLHVWSETEAQLDDVGAANLKELMAQQTPLITANLSPLSGATLVSSSNDLYLGAASGNVLRWNPTNPEAVDALVRLPSPARTFSMGRRHLVVVTTKGELRLVELVGTNFTDWSLEANAEFAAATPERYDAFAAVADGELVFRKFNDGEYLWRTALPEGSVCGLGFSPDASKLVVCVDGGLIVVDPDTGQATAAFRRTGDEIEWRD